MLSRGWKRAWTGGVFLLTFLALPCPAQEEEGEAAPVPDGARIGAPDSRSSVEDIPDSVRWGENDQVSVTGGNPRARTMFASYVRELRKDFRWSIYKSHQTEQLVSNRDEWNIPIRVELWGEVTDVYRGDDARMSVELRPDGRFHLILAARLHDEFEESEFRLETIRALVIEQMLNPFVRDPYALGVEKLVAPEWLVHGFDAMIDHRQNGQQSVLYAGVLKSGLFLSPEELFALESPRDLDPISYAIFRVSASSMVTALLEQPEGDLGMREFLGDLTVYAGGGAFPLLKKHFPAFREMEQGLEKWWTLEVATMGQQQRFEFLDRHETERWLTEALTIRFEAGETAPAGVPEKRGLFERFKKEKEAKVPEESYVGFVDQFPEFIDREGADLKLAQAFNKLQHVKVMGFPLYRPLIDRYEIALEQLGRGETKGISTELAELAELRETIANTLERAEDFLNYFEATQAPQRSDVFNDYMEMRKELGRREAPRRQDRITLYLDSLEAEFR